MRPSPIYDDYPSQYITGSSAAAAFAARNNNGPQVSENFLFGGRGGHAAGVKPPKRQRPKALQKSHRAGLRPESRGKASESLSQK